MKYALPTLLLLSVIAAGCTTTAPTSTGATAVAVLEPRSGSQASGSVRFVENADGSVTVIADLTGTTAGQHGFHIHEKGDCSAADATSAGPHYDVDGNPHGGMDSPARHTGDFGNLTADGSGAIRTQFTTRAITVSPGVNSVVGKAVILHASADDLTSQPAGNSGARIACGVANLQVNGGN